MIEIDMGQVNLHIIIGFLGPDGEVTLVLRENKVEEVVFPLELATGIVGQLASIALNLTRLLIIGVLLLFLNRQTKELFPHKACFFSSSSSIDATPFDFFSLLFLFPLLNKHNNNNIKWRRTKPTMITITCSRWF